MEYPPNYCTPLQYNGVLFDGVSSFRTKSLLNKRGSSCFAVGAIIVRLQDVAEDNVEPTVWLVTNHNLLQRCTFLAYEGRYHLFKPSPRYVRWMPQCPREYMLIEEVVPICTKTGESHAAVVMPDKDKLDHALRLRQEYRNVAGLPKTGKGYHPCLMSSDFFVYQEQDNQNSTTGSSSAPSDLDSN